jgi:hypothetical protein
MSPFIAGVLCLESMAQTVSLGPAARRKNVYAKNAIHPALKYTKGNGKFPKDPLRFCASVVPCPRVSLARLPLFVDKMTVGRPQVEYKETLTQMAEDEGLSVRRIAGRDHYALARIRLFRGQRLSRVVLSVM